MTNLFLELGAWVASQLTRQSKTKSQDRCKHCGQVLVASAGRTERGRGGIVNNLLVAQNLKMSEIRVKEAIFKLIRRKDLDVKSTVRGAICEIHAMYGDPAHGLMRGREIFSYAGRS